MSASGESASHVRRRVGEPKGLRAEEKQQDGKSKLQSKLWLFKLTLPRLQLPVLYEELFKGMISDMIPDSRDDWDNQSNDEAVPDITSAEDCAAACVKDKKCLQSTFKGDECVLGTSRIVLGQKHDTDTEGKGWTSHWNKARIAEWVAKEGPCDKIIFPFEYDAPR